MAKQIKIGRNDKCHCGSDIKYKRCCMQKDEMVIKKPNVTGVLRKAYDIKLGDDFYSRYLFGLGKIKDCVYSREKRLDYDNSFSPIFQNLLETKYAREYSLDLIKKHKENIECNNDGIIQGHQININDPIDDRLNMFFKDFFIRGSIAIDCLIKHTRYMGYDIGFLFSDKEEKFKKGLKRFPIPETDKRYEYLRDMISHNKESWYTQFREMRGKIEHDGYKLPNIKYDVENDKVIPVYPMFGKQTIENILDICWQNLSNLCEEIIVYLISLNLPPDLIIVLIPTESRDLNLPIKFAVRYKEFPEVNFSCS